MSDETTNQEGGAAAPPARVYTEADVSGLKAKTQELLDKLAGANQRLSVLGDRTPEQIKADLELAAETRTAKAKAEGDFESLKSQLITQHQTELEKATVRAKKAEGKLYDVMARRGAESAITAKGGNPKILLPHVLPHVRVIEIDDDFTIQVVDAKGNPRIADGQATPMTIDQLVEAFKADETFGAAFAAPAAAGSGARGSGGGGGGGSSGKIIIPKDASHQEYQRLRAEAIKTNREWGYAS